MMGVAIVVVAAFLLRLILMVVVVSLVGVMMMLMGVMGVASSSAISWAIVDECILMIAHRQTCIPGRDQNGPPRWDPEQSFPGVLGPLDVEQHFLRREVVVVVEHPAEHLEGVAAVTVVVLHVGVPHEVGELVGDDEGVGAPGAEVEELDVVAVALLEVQQLEGEVLHEPALPHAARHQPLPRHLAPVDQRVQLPHAVHRTQPQTFLREVLWVLEVLLHQLGQLRRLRREQAGGLQELQYLFVILEQLPQVS